MSATQVTVTSTQVAVRYRRNVGTRSTCWPTVGQQFSIDISTEISAERRSRYLPISRLICRQTHLNRYVGRPTYRSSIGRYVDRHLIDMSTDISVEGAQNTYNPKQVTYSCFKQLSR